MKKRIAFHTFGCKLNFSETSSIARQFREDDYETVDFKDQADIYVINSCSVTGIAEKKCRAAIKQAHKRNPSASIAVIGCFSQLKPDEIARFENVDIILGSASKFELYDLISRSEEISPVIHTDSKEEFATNDFIPGYSSGDRTRSFVKVQDGCDYHCAYCTIPLARGNSRSGSIAQVLDTVSGALRTGIKEIVLTGVNVGDFGKGTGDRLIDLLRALEEVNRISRIRISSIEPDLLTDEIIEFVASSNRFLPHFHIPLQSGSNAVLAAMKRRYKRETFESRVLKIRQLMPYACIAADVIVGFPGESEENFMETYRFIEWLPISYTHVFTYSERPGTPAGDLPAQVPPAGRHRRSQELHELSEKKKRIFYESNQGRSFQVLFESDNDHGFMHGFTENYIKVKTPFDDSLVNQVREVTLETLEPDLCFLVCFV